VTGTKAERQKEAGRDKKMMVFGKENMKDTYNRFEFLEKYNVMKIFQVSKNIL